MLRHWAAADALGREQLPAVAAFRYNSSVGFIQQTNAAGQVAILVDIAASCNGPVALKAEASEILQTIAAPPCEPSGYATVEGVIPTGGSTFQIMFQCGEGQPMFRQCDAQGTGAALLVCAPEEP